MHKLTETMTRMPAITHAMIKAKQAEVDWFVRNRVRLLIEYGLIVVCVALMSVTFTQKMEFNDAALQYEHQIAILLIQHEDDLREAAMLRATGSAPIPESRSLVSPANCFEVGK